MIDSPRLKRLARRIFAWTHLVLSPENRWDCPICLYKGPFLTVRPPAASRRFAQCPNCGGVERHRIQKLVTDDVFLKLGTLQKKRMLHFAPEDFFRDQFKPLFEYYCTADIARNDVDFKEDLTRLSFPDASFDVIFASHVLEHITDDAAALREISRCLRPGGVAIIPVPIIGINTIEYPAPNPHEWDHVRCPGSDYYDRYEKHFSRVQLYRSEDFDKAAQTFIYEDRTTFSRLDFPLRPSISGVRHRDIVPACWKAS